MTPKNNSTENQDIENFKTLNIKIRIKQNPAFLNRVLLMFCLKNLIYK